MPTPIYAPHWHSSPPPTLKTPILPQTRVGWWGLVLLGFTGLFPFYWSSVEGIVTDASVLGAFLLPLLALVLIVTSFGLGYRAIAHDHDWSFVLTTIFVVVAVEVMFGLIIGLAAFIG
ncbi:MAG: hypothetical protein LH645_01620 [Actinomycetia bacterium]|nr:hypothetical protein [Actinomycetes bacterium]